MWRNIGSPVFAGLEQHVRSSMPATLLWFDGVEARMNRVKNPRAVSDRLVRRCAKLPRVTEALWRAVLYSFLADRGHARTINDMMDIGHAIVPTAYCDLVVLDGHWRNMVEGACKRIRKEGSTAPMARHFGAGPSGLDRFLTSLETWVAPVV
jgi:hypothetical protein